MPQVIMQLRVVLLGALTKYNFYLVASSPCLVMYNVNSIHTDEQRLDVRCIRMPGEIHILLHT